ncbi:MAG: tetratricopeptide repeat protein, partial [Pseudomonadota bacterium]
MSYRFSNFELISSSRELLQDGSRVDIEPKSFDLLLFLVENRERAVTKNELLDAIWPSQVVTETALTRCIMKTRRVLGDESGSQSLIRTVHGHGYQFVGELIEGPQDVAPLTLSAANTRSSKTFGTLVVAAAVAIALAAFFFLQTVGESFDAERVVVLPVNNSADDPELDWAELGMMSLMQKSLEDADIVVSSSQEVIHLLGDSRFDRPPDSEQLSTLTRQFDANVVVHSTLSEQGALLELTSVITNLDGVRARRVIVGNSAGELAMDMAATLAGMIETGGEPSHERANTLSTDPFVNEMYARALGLALRGDYAGARDMFGLVARQEPELFWPRYEIAITARELGELDEADVMFRELVEEARGLADGRALVSTLNAYATLKLDRNELESADALLLEAFGLAAERGLLVRQAAVSANLGLVDRRLGDSEAASVHFEDAVSIYQTIGESPPPVLLNNYSGLMLRIGRLEAARDMSERAIAGFRTQGDRRSEAQTTNRLAHILRRLGDFDNALEKHRASMEIYNSIGDSRGAIHAQSGMTAVYRETGDLTRGRHNAKDVIEKASAADNIVLLSDGYMQSAYIEANLEEHNAAIAEYHAAIDLFEVRRHVLGTRAAKIGIVVSLLELGRVDEAYDVASDYMQAARESG